MDEQDIPFFTAVAPETFRWPIRLLVPGDGKYEQAEVMGVFKWMSREDAEAMVGVDEKGVKRHTDLEICKQVLLAVEMKYKDGTPVESSPQLVERFLSLNTATVITIGTWLGAMQGVAAQKN